MARMCRSQWPGACSRRRASVGNCLSAITVATILLRQCNGPSVSTCSSSALPLPPVTLSAASIDSDSAPGKSVARSTGPAGFAVIDRCSADAARSSKVILRGFLRDTLVQHQVRDRTTKPLLLPQILHTPRPVGLQPPIFFVPPVEVYSLAAIRGHASAVDAPLVRMTSTSRSLPMISSDTCFLLGIRYLILGPDCQSLWATQRGADQLSRATVTPVGRADCYWMSARL